MEESYSHPQKSPKNHLHLDRPPPLLSIYDNFDLQILAMLWFDYQIDFDLYLNSMFKCLIFNFKPHQVPQE